MKNWIRLPGVYTGLCALAFTSAAAGCGAGTPQADEPENASDDASAPSQSAFDTEGHSAGSKVDPVVGVTIKDEKKKEAAPCQGDDFPDLLSVLSQAACEVPDPQPEANPRDLSAYLEIKVTPDAPKVAPGGTAKVLVVFHNKAQKAMRLDFAVDPEPRFEFEVYTPKGSRVDKPAGDEPSLPPEVANAPQADKGIARIILAPGGTAKLTETWSAVKYKWVTKDKAKGALPGHGYPREPAGPLPKGKYVLRVITPLVGLTEGVDHEMTQPRVPIEVGAL